MLRLGRARSTVHYLEEWETEADMRRRVRSPRFTSLLAVMESPQEPPQVQFDFVTRTRGIDYVAEIRAELGAESGRRRGHRPGTKR